MWSCISRRTFLRGDRVIERRAEKRGFTSQQCSLDVYKLQAMSYTYAHRSNTTPINDIMCFIMSVLGPTGDPFD